jgi:hypothetical protein
MRQPVESKRVMESCSRQRGFWHNVRDEEGKNKQSSFKEKPD